MDQGRVEPQSAHDQGFVTTAYVVRGSFTMYKYLCTRYIVPRTRYIVQVQRNTSAQVCAHHSTHSRNLRSTDDMPPHRSYSVLLRAVPMDDDEDMIVMQQHSAGQRRTAQRREYDLYHVLYCTMLKRYIHPAMSISLECINACVCLF